MALKRGHRICGRLVVAPGRLDVVAIGPKPGLQRGDRRAGVADPERLVADDWGRSQIMSNALESQRVPGEKLAGIDLAPHGDVGMGQHALFRYAAAFANIARQRGDRRDLPRRIGAWIVVTGMHDFDADRGRVHVGFAAPKALAGVPGASRLRHELEHAAVLFDEVMGGDLRRRVAEQIERARSRRHAGVMQDQHGDRPQPFAMVRGGDNSGERIVG